jgi:hypothetical protein
LAGAQEGGGDGIFSFLFDSGKNSRLITDAFSVGNVAAALFLMDKGFDIDMSYTDKDKKNALHHMIQYSTRSKPLNTKLSELLRSGVDRHCVNQPDVNGDTPLHIAAGVGNDYIAELLVNNGATVPTKPNRFGDFVEMNHNEKPATEDSSCVTNIFIKPDQSPSKNGSNDKMVNKQVSDRLDSIIKHFTTGSATDTIGFDRAAAENEPTIAGTDAEPQVVPEPLNIPANAAPAPAVTGDVTDTDDFIKGIFNKLTMEGGAVSGDVSHSHRRIETFSDVSDLPIVSEGGFYSANSSDYESSMSDYSEYARASKSQKNELHEQTVKKIMEVLGIDDEYTARSYKALLYQKVKEEDKDNAMSGLDRATKMLSLVKKTELKKFKKAQIDPIYDHLVKKDKERAERLKNKAANSSDNASDMSLASSSESGSASDARSSSLDLSTEYVLSSEL